MHTLVCIMYTRPPAVIHSSGQAELACPPSCLPAKLCGGLGGNAWLGAVLYFFSKVPRMDRVQDSLPSYILFRCFVALLNHVQIDPR